MLQEDVWMYRLLAFALAAFIANPAGAAVFAFGDSLSDLGNDRVLTGGGAPPASRYTDGRFTNNGAWLDYLAAGLGLQARASREGFDVTAEDQLVSFAYGGAGSGTSNVTPGGFPVPGLLGQVTAFAGSGVDAGDDDLFIVWSGSNDYLLGLANSPDQPVANIASAVDELRGLGAEKFLIVNLPNLGDVPLSVAQGAQAPLNALTAAHNAALAAALAGQGVTFLDVNALFQAALDDPAAFGFTSGLAAGPAAGCLFPPFDCSPVSYGGSFFWDELHPSTAVHRLIGQAALDALGVPEPSALALLGLGLLAIRRVVAGRGSSRAG
jgi:phospholipase/lecithinase/hemolysin